MNKWISKCCKAPIKYKVQVQGHYWADTEEEAQNKPLDAYASQLDFSDQGYACSKCCNYIKEIKECYMK